MDVVALIGIGLLTGATTVLFGFGGGFVTVPVVVWADAALGADAMQVATATSALVMVVNAGFATAVTPRRVLLALRGSGMLLLLLAAGASVGALATRLAPADLARWAFVAYVALTIADVLLRPGFLRPGSRIEATSDAPRPLPTVLGAPAGAVAAFLGVGGSVMTVPAMRRAGHTMRVATALANPSPSPSHCRPPQCLWAAPRSPLPLTRTCNWWGSLTFALPRRCSSELCR